MGSISIDPTDIHGLQSLNLYVSPEYTTQKLKFITYNLLFFCFEYILNKLEIVSYKNKHSFMVCDKS